MGSHVFRSLFSPGKVQAGPFGPIRAPRDFNLKKRNFERNLFGNNEEWVKRSDGANYVRVEYQPAPLAHIWARTI